MSGGHLVGTFLEMMSAERGAARNTIEAYRRDLSDYCAFLARRGTAVTAAGREQVTQYLAELDANGMAASSSARKLSAIRQFHRFLAADGVRTDDPTRIIASPKPRRALPKVLSLGEIDRLLQLAEAEIEREGASDAERVMSHRLYVLLELLYATGMRVSELVGLRRAAVPRDAEFLTIRGKGGKEAVELADGGKAPCAARGGKARLLQLGEPGGDQLARGGGRVGSPPGEEGPVVRQIAALGLDGVPRRAALGAHHFEEGLDVMALAHSIPGERVWTSGASTGAAAGGGGSAASGGPGSRGAAGAGSAGAVGLTLVSISRR
jgi:integrase/recombinase XerD